MALADDTRPRCSWVPAGDPLYVAYHDEEWGVPSHDDRHLFEMLVLEGAQAGLSWSTILRKREGYRSAFAGFDAEAVARFGPADVERLIADPGIVRNRLKVESAIANAQAVLAAREAARQPRRLPLGARPGRPVSRGAAARCRPRPPSRGALSKALKRAGFRFVGPTVCYAFMQAVGMVDDHSPECFRYGG